MRAPLSLARSVLGATHSPRIKISRCIGLADAGQGAHAALLQPDQQRAHFVFQTHDRPPFVFAKHTHAGSIFAMNDLAA
jgi:hypothetical protein